MKPPAHLSKEAKVVWERLASDPAYTGLFGATDMLALEIVCTNYVDWTKAKTAVEEYQSKLMQTKKEPSKAENRKLFGLIMTLKQTEASLRNWLNSCGMTPPMRTRTDPPTTKIDEEPIDVTDLSAEEQKILRRAVSKRKRKAA